MVTLGIKPGPEQYPPTELLEYAVIAEDAGFEALDMSDHFHPWSKEGHACFIRDCGRDVLPAIRKENTRQVALA